MTLTSGWHWRVDDPVSCRPIQPTRMMAGEADGPVVNFLKICNAINPTNANNIDLDDTDEQTTVLGAIPSSMSVATFHFRCYSISTTSSPLDGKGGFLPSGLRKDEFPTTLNCWKIYIAFIPMSLKPLSLWGNMKVYTKNSSYPNRSSIPIQIPTIPHQSLLCNVH